MEAVAKARFVRSSPRKLRRVAQLIKGKNVTKALATLSYTPKYAALVLEKVVKSATANALVLEGTAKLKAEDLLVKNVIVDGGPTLKRIRAVGMGRAYMIRKPTAHVTVLLAEDLKAKALRERQAKLQAEKSGTKKKGAAQSESSSRSESPGGKSKESKGE